MKYLKQVLKVLIWPVVFFAGQFFIKYLFVAFYNSQNIFKYRKIFPNMSDLEIIDTLKYKFELNNFLNDKAFFITFITFIIFGLIFLYNFKNYIKGSNVLKLKTILKIFLIGICISLFYNILILNINDIVHITDRYYISDIPLIVLVLTSGIMGPILEELLFRGIVYNKLLKFNNHKNACIITSIIFALMHFPNIINVFYTFILSFIFIYLYDRYKTIKAPILLHISINTTINLFLPLLLYDNIVNYVVFLITIFIIFIMILKNLK